MSGLIDDVRIYSRAVHRQAEAYQKMSEKFRISRKGPDFSRVYRCKATSTPWMGTVR